MRKLFAIAAGAVVAISLSASVANAAPTATSAVPITPQGDLYKEVKKPIDITFTANITPAPTDATATPLLSTNFSLPKDIAFVPDPKMPVCTAINDNNFNFPPDAAIQTCPDSVIGNGTATIILAGAIFPPILPPITDPKITIFNGGTADDGGGILLIHAYSASTNAAVLMTGSIVDGNLNVAIPRITADSATTTFTLNIPGDLGQTASYAQASCSSGDWTTNATFELGNRSETGVVSNQSTLVTPETTQACTGLAGKAKFASLKIKAPKKVKSGKKGAFKVTVKNTGTASSKKGKITASGAGKGSATLPAVKPGASKTITVKAKVKGKKGKKVTVKFKAAGGVSASGKAKVKVG